MSLEVSDAFVAPNGTLELQAFGGMPPYTFAVIPGGAGGTVQGSTYTAPPVVGIDSLIATDALGTTGEFDLTIDPPVFLSAPYTAIAQCRKVLFGATGGTATETNNGGMSYRYNLVSGPGRISEEGWYHSDEETGLATVNVTDDFGRTSTATILVGSPLELFCDVLQVALGLDPGRVWLWNQKVNEPTDSGMYIVVRVISTHVFGQSTGFCSSDTGLNQVQSSYINVMLQVEVKSRSDEAVWRLPEIAQALGSYYSQSQQEFNSFAIFPGVGEIVDLSGEDGAAIPYRFSVPVRIQLTKQRVTPVPYYDTFQPVQFSQEA